MLSLADFISTLTRLIRNTPLTEFALWLQKQPASQFADKHFWFVPSFQVVHILAIGMLFGSAVMINMRILMLAGRSRTMAQTVNRYLPWIWYALVVLLLTGIGLTFSDPVREITNPLFWTKMILVVFAVLTNLGFQTSVSRDPALWDSSPAKRITVRLGAVGGIVLWCVIMALGRWIAYAGS